MVFVENSTLKRSATRNSPQSANGSLGCDIIAETVPLLTEEADDDGDYFVRNQEE
jgi:hypothetical protein